MRAGARARILAPRSGNFKSGEGLFGWRSGALIVLFGWVDHSYEGVTQ